MLQSLYLLSFASHKVLNPQPTQEFLNLCYTKGTLLTVQHLLVVESRGRMVTAFHFPKMKMFILKMESIW